MVAGGKKATGLGDECADDGRSEDLEPIRGLVFPARQVEEGNRTSWKGGKLVEWQHGEFPSEQDEAGDLEAILEWEEFWILESEPPIEPTPEYVPMDDYLEKDLERQEQQKLAEMVEDRIP